MSKREVDLKDFEPRGLPSKAALKEIGPETKCYNDDGKTTVGKFVEMLTEGYELFKLGEPKFPLLSNEEILVRVVGNTALVAKRDIHFSWELTTSDVDYLMSSLSTNRKRRDLWEPPEKPAYIGLSEFIASQKQIGRVVGVNDQDEFFSFLRWDGWCHSLE